MKKIRDAYLILDNTTPLTFKQKIKREIKKTVSRGYELGLNTIYVKPRENVRYKVSVCAIFKNESPYLMEWIEFNHIIGIEHFYLYNNNSDDDYLSVLEPYVSSGLVTLLQWPKNQAQMECYKDCIEKYREETQWLGFIDIDEFIVPIAYNNIYDFLRPFETKRGAVKIYWKMFGSSGLLDRDPHSLVTESFYVSWPLYYAVGKCFYNTSFDFNFQDPKNSNLHHCFWANYRGRRIPPVNAFDRVCMHGIDSVKHGQHPIQINHYFSKSYREYAAKKAKGDVFFKVNPHDEEYFYLHESENTSTDYSAYKYLIKLKLRMAEKKNWAKDHST